MVTVLALPARAQEVDPKNVLQDLPLRLDDASPIRPGSRQLHGIFRYERTGNQLDRFRLVPRFAMGLRGNSEVTLAAPFLAGNAGRKGSGDLQVEFQHQFQQGNQRRPDLAFVLQGQFPTGEQSAGVDTVVKLLATQSLGGGNAEPKLHLNLGWKHNAGTGRGERRDGYLAILGYTRALGERTLLLADFASEQELQDASTIHVAEVGIRHQTSRSSVISLGIGTGVTSQSPRFRATLGFQVGF